MAAMATMQVTFDPETLAAIRELGEQIRALRDLLETKPGTEVHCHFQGSGLSPADLTAAVRKAARMSVR